MQYFTLIIITVIHKQTTRIGTKNGKNVTWRLKKPTDWSLEKPRAKQHQEQVHILKEY